MGFCVLALGSLLYVEVFADAVGAQAPVPFFSLLNAVVGLDMELVRKTEVRWGPAAMGEGEKTREKRGKQRGLLWETRGLCGALRKNEGERGRAAVF